MKIVILSDIGFLKNSCILITRICKKKNVIKIIYEKKSNNPPSSGKSKIIKQKLLSILKRLILPTYYINNCKKIKELVFLKRVYPADNSLRSKPDDFFCMVNNYNDKESVSLIKRLEPDIIICVTGRILKKEIIDIPKIGIINLHGGVLPEYRGCHPIFWAIYNNELDKIGFSIHFVNEKIDAGDIIYKENIKVSFFDTIKTLHLKIILYGTRAMSKVLNQIENGSIVRHPQDGARAHYYRQPLLQDYIELQRKLANRDFLSRVLTLELCKSKR